MTDSKTAGEACRACGWGKGHWEGCRGEATLQIELASLQEQAHIDKDFIGQYQREVASLKKENERLKSDSSSGLSVKYKLELLKQIWKLQLENGVMRSALERINEYCNDPSCGSVSKHALSTSTKSSLMEKVRAFIQIFDGQTEPLHPISWMAALTEVKKEIA
jgi:hypothetical protein